MSDPNFDHSEGGNWDDKPGDPIWGEFQWRNYLKSSDRETARFLSIYNSLKDQPNHLDEVASLMGGMPNMSMTDEFSSMRSTSKTSNRCADNIDGALYPAQTPGFCRHPLSLPLPASELGALHDAESKQLSPQLCWQYANSLHQAEMNVLLSIQALDLGDFGLAICHLKNSLSALNQT